MWRRNKAKALLKWFLLNPGKLCSADQFIDLFWPDLPLEAAFSNLYVTIHCLRRLLEPSLSPRQESKFIRRQSNNFYWLNLDESWWTDTLEIHQLFETAKAFDLRQEDARASYYYRKVASYCSLGFLVEDESEEWLSSYRRHYEYIYAQALGRLISIYQQRGELEEVLEYAYQALSADPFCEPAAKAIIDVYLKQGNLILAAHKFDIFRNFIQNELGVGLSQDVQALGQQINAAS
ncbi:MAG: hypothetical protein H0W02_03105 [Ktedonobacteraceae bacterium]|nr:hypothetical protein [Ktedonobacteraceae bacterium]